MLGWFSRLFEMLSGRTDGDEFGDSQSAPRTTHLPKEDEGSRSPRWAVRLTLEDLRVIHYTEERIENPYPRGRLPGSVYHKVRNAIVRACHRHGPTGPLGELPLHRTGIDAILHWERGDEEPAFYVVDDQYNDERYLYMELSASSFVTTEWLEDIVFTLSDHSGWGIGCRLPLGYLLIFDNRLMVQGPGFEDCHSAASVLESIRKQIDMSKQGST